MRLLGLTCLLALSLSTRAEPTASLQPDAVGVQTPVQTPDPFFSATAAPAIPLKGMKSFGLGFGNVGADLSWQKWTSDTFGHEWLLAFGASGREAGSSYASYHADLRPGFGLKGLVAQHGKYLILEWLAQLKANLSYLRNQNPFSPPQDRWSVGASAFLGIGFEAFLPYWRNLALEGCIGLGGRYARSFVIDNAGPYLYGLEDSWSFQTEAFGMGPWTVRLRYYY